MCDIKQQTNLKTKTVYKVVYKVGGNYYAMFSGLIITLGQVQKMQRANSLDGISPFLDYQASGSFLYNSLMVGRTSGFSSLKAARILRDYNRRRNLVIIKVRLGGSILKGTAKDILPDSILSDKYITYAGTEVLSIKEVE